MLPEVVQILWIAGIELAAAARRELVVSRASILLGDAPLGVDQLAFLEPDERVVERAIFDCERAARAFLNPGRDLETVECAEPDMCAQVSHSNPSQRRTPLRGTTRPSPRRVTARVSGSWALEGA